MCLIPRVLTRLSITKPCLLSFGGYISNAAGHLVSARRVSDAQAINHSTARGTRARGGSLLFQTQDRWLEKGAGPPLFWRPRRKTRWCGNNFLGVNDVYLKPLLVIHQAATGGLHTQISQGKRTAMRNGGDVSQQDGSWFSGQKWAMQKTRLRTFLTFYFYPKQYN